ncbi:hypothetical protein KDA_55890 [Dictyobacter alpinus]|uniref:Uncharacterized protein n=1 Tax=Dictyobacter alpinus TaxID=2014873 RepID=A0A402BFD9_9CHLR|nr:hypothetical protein KDA_55890 [Dictyobacter alpinus]
MVKWIECIQPIPLFYETLHSLSNGSFLTLLLLVCKAGNGKRWGNRRGEYAFYLAGTPEIVAEKV